jgi:hypothetical protein
MVRYREIAVRKFAQKTVRCDIQFPDLSNGELAASVAALMKFGGPFIAFCGRPKPREKLPASGTPPASCHYQERSSSKRRGQGMGYLVWGSLALLGGTGGLVATGHANLKLAEVMAALVLIALAGACIWRLR